MKRKSERRPNWAAAPPYSRRCSLSSPGVKKSRSSTSQELHHLDQQDDLYLDITDRLCFAILLSRPKSSSNVHYFSIDNELEYENFYADFGPLNLAMVYRYCCKINKKLKSITMMRKKIIHFTGPDQRKQANAAFLVGCYMHYLLHKVSTKMLESGLRAAKGVVVAELPSPKYKFIEFHWRLGYLWIRGSCIHGPLTTSNTNRLIPCVDNTTISSCSKKAWPVLLSRFFLTLKMKVSLGNSMRSSPSTLRSCLDDKVQNIKCTDASNEDYFHIDTSIMVRERPAFMLRRCRLQVVHQSSQIKKPELNRALTAQRLLFNAFGPIYIRRRSTLYNVRGFNVQMSTGMAVPSPWAQGGSPAPVAMAGAAWPAETMQEALLYARTGLGRTGTLIACYIMKHYRMTATETIAWVRICRPGSVIGPQQQFLMMKQASLWIEGDYFRQKLRGQENGKHRAAVSKLLLAVDDISINGVENQDKQEPELYSDDDEINGVTQGDRLRALKSRRQSKTNAVPLTVILQSSVQSCKTSEPNISGSAGITKRTTRSASRKSSFKSPSISRTKTVLR
ncbi:dual specificity protein phosphatase CDC14B [Moschus berezovskii]|uniref:dual specificity protein phosphatase CDC14B n=1 Tax=Moschus berezovskii TaxID=68408 RepID=UPI002444540F|nr:dual specificity protein phosphatase CDC14B [Moschus berezovskii]